MTQPAERDRNGRRRAEATEVLRSTFPSATELLGVREAFLLEAIVTAAEARSGHAGMHAHPIDTAASVVVGVPRLWPVGMDEDEAVQHLIMLVGYRIQKQAMQLSFYKGSKVLDDTRPDDTDGLVGALRGLDVKRRLHKLAARLPEAEADFLRRLALHEEVWSLIGVRGAARQVARCLGLSYVNYRQLLHRITWRVQHRSASQNSRRRSVG